MKLTLALIQMNVAESKEQNLRSARQWLQAAADKGAGMAVLPEMFTNPYQPRCFEENAEPLEGSVYEMLSEAARQTKMWIVGGSFAERADNRLYNTSLVFAPDGKLAKVYRKAHLFAMNIEGQAAANESRTLAAGGKVAVVQADGFRFGVAICFDIRFPEWFRLMRGVELVVLPAAFHPVTGAAHWQLLLRSRALDNQCYVAGAAPARGGNRIFEPYAHSMLCNPWGMVLGELGEEEGMLLREIDFDEVACTRKELPVLGSLRDDLYAVKPLPRS